MGAQKGKDLLVKLDDGSGTFITAAGLRARQLAFNTAIVDVTNADSAGRWRELLAGAGAKRAAVSGSGVFKDEASDARLRQAFFDGAVQQMQLVIPDFGTVAGPFQITGLEYRGDQSGEVTFDMTLESAGALARRFGEGGLRARDLVAIVGAGLRGAGEPVSEDDLRALPLADALPELAAAATALLAATFGDVAPNPPRAPAG